MLKAEAEHVFTGTYVSYLMEETSVIKRIVRMGFEGPDAELGRIPAGDVARFLLGLERAMAVSSLALLGREVRQGGRRGRAVEQAIRLRLDAIEAGSVVSVLSLPEEEESSGPLDLDVATLAEQAVDKTIRTVTGDDQEPAVARALVDLSDSLGIGERYEALWVEREGQRGRIDEDRHQQLRELSRTPPREDRDDRVVGTLVEADFEKETARLRVPDGRAVVVQFDETLADEIQQALREPAEFEGRVAYDPKTAVATSVELQTITRADQLIIGFSRGDFWHTPTIEDLRREKQVEPVEDLRELRDEDASDEEVDAFMAAIDG